MPTTTSNDFSETAAISMPSNLDVPIDPWPVEQSLIPYNNMGGFDMSYSNNTWF
jgi:hypothetical protein